MRLPPELERFMLEMQVEASDARRRAILADPAKHKLTREFPAGARLNWRFWQVKGKRAPRVRYCYSTERNLAGYFLGWREVWDAKRGQGRRDMWIASKRRTTVREKALQRKRVHEARLGGPK